MILKEQSFVTDQLFMDLKKIYQAHDRGEEPDHFTLSRTTETLIRFLKMEITHPYLPHDIDTEDHTLYYEVTQPKYEKALSKLQSAYGDSDYKKMSIWIDNVLDLEHVYGSAWVRLLSYAQVDPDASIVVIDPMAKAKHASLQTFLRSIGRFS